MIVIGTTISLVFTIVAAQLVDRHQRAKDRQLTALTVMSGITMYEQTLEYVHELLGRSDTVAQWLLSRPVEELEQLPEEELLPLVDDAVQLYSLTYDNTTYEIFSSSIETWKNMRNYQFVITVGMCYSLMQSTVEKWDQWGDEVDEIKQRISNNLNEYPGANLAIKYLRNKEFRTELEAMHNRRDWILYRAKTLQYYNLLNMTLMDISEDELMSFLEKSMEQMDVEMEMPDRDYETPALSPDSLSSLAPIEARLDSILQHK